MSFRKANSYYKNEKKFITLESPIRPFDSLFKLFSRNSNNIVHKRNESFSFSNRVPAVVKQPLTKEFDFLWNLELVLIYTSNLLRQKIDDVNRANLVQQYKQCSTFLQTHLTESQNFVNNLSSNLPAIQSIKESLNQFKNTHEEFCNWIINEVNTTENFDHNIAQDLFFNMEIKAQVFIDKLKRALQDADKDYKRSSIDNSSLISLSLRSNASDSSRKSCFSEEDRKLIDKLKKLEQNIDLPPPKPAVSKIDPEILDSYLNQIEQAVKSQTGSVYEDYTLINNHNNDNNNNNQNEMRSVKIENNCIMACSMISNDILPVDMDSTEEFTPTPNESDSCPNEFLFPNFDETSIPKTIISEGARNFPLPPVPSEDKTVLRSKLSKITNFPSEEIHFRKTSLMAASDFSKMANGSIGQFDRHSPLRSPSLINSLNLQYNRSPETKLPLAIDNQPNNNSEHSFLINSPTSDDRSSFRSSNSSHRWLLMAKQIPSVVEDTNDLLNITDMQDDIKILTQHFDASNVDDKAFRFSDISNKTDLSIDSGSLNQSSNSMGVSSSNNEVYCDSEVKSDTEEYFEYFEIDGKKYRRKMKKRTVIEKIKIRKTVLAPMKPDGSGPDFRNLENYKDYTDCLGNDVASIDDDRSQEENMTPYYSEMKPRFRRGYEDRLRVSKSMFYPYNQMKRMTLCHPPNLKNDTNNKLFPLANYMYRFGESNFEEPIVDKRFSTQLTDEVSSAWIKTSESILPHEKSKSICFLKKYREKNTEGSTIHNAVRVTASRTIRMKGLGNGNQPETSVPGLTLPVLSITNNTEEEEPTIEGDDSDTSLCGTDTRSSLHDSLLQSSEDEKEDEDEDISFRSDSVISEPDTKAIEIMTVSEKDFRGESLDEPVDNDSVPTKRSYSSDSCFYSSKYSSYSLETKEQYSFILTETNVTQYLIFDEDPKFGECDIAGGPVDALIVYACDGKEHLLFLGAFLDTYRTFIEPWELIDRLIIRYKFFREQISFRDETQPNSEDKNDKSNENLEKKCNHVLSLLLTVIGKLKLDLTDEINDQIENFQIYLKELKQDQWILPIKRALESQRQCMEIHDKIAETVLELSSQPPIQNDLKSPIKEFSSPSKSLITFNSNKPNILSFSSREIAEQMTLLDWCKYRKVELMEILNLKDIVNCNLPGVIEYAKNFENVQFWTQSILLDTERMPDKDKGCNKFLRIMKHLQRLNNFSSFIAILLAIQLLPTKKLFSKRVRSKIKEYDNYMKPPRFSGYKEDLKQASAPCIPFLGIFYQDIVMLNIANPPYLELEEIMKLNDKSNFTTNNNQLLFTNAATCGPIINFWRSFKQYIFLKNCNKDQDKIRYSIEPNEKILHFLNNYKDSFDEAKLQRLMKQYV